MRRCAIYARYSSDLQRDSSIEDQLRKCRAYAAQKGWDVLDQFVRCDQAKSGASLTGREGLQELVAAAKSKPRPFDCILVEDSSRLARNIADSLKTVEILQFYGVSVVYVSQGIDSAYQNARTQLTVHGIVDEQFLMGL